MPEERREDDWVQSWGDPRDSVYLSLDEINEGLEALDALKPMLAANGELAAFLGWHPPSFFSYAIEHAQKEHETPGMRGVPPTSYGAVMWMDGVLTGMMILLLMGTNRDD